MVAIERCLVTMNDGVVTTTVYLYGQAMNRTMTNKHGGRVLLKNQAGERRRNKLLFGADWWVVVTGITRWWRGILYGRSTDSDYRWSGCWYYW